MKAYDLELKIGDVDTSTGRLLVTASVPRQGASTVQIFAHDPSDLRKTGILTVLDRNQLSGMIDMLNQASDAIAEMEGRGPLKAVGSEYEVRLSNFSVTLSAQLFQEVEEALRTKTNLVAAWKIHKAMPNLTLPVAEQVAAAIFAQLKPVTDVSKPSPPPAQTVHDRFLVQDPPSYKWRLGEQVDYQGTPHVVVGLQMWGEHAYPVELIPGVVDDGEIVDRRPCSERGGHHWGEEVKAEGSKFCRLKQCWACNRIKMTLTGG